MVVEQPQLVVEQPLLVAKQSNFVAEQPKLPNNSYWTIPLLADLCTSLCSTKTAQQNCAQPVNSCCSQSTTFGKELYALLFKGSLFLCSTTKIYRTAKQQLPNNSCAQLPTVVQRIVALSVRSSWNQGHFSTDTSHLVLLIHGRSVSRFAKGTTLNDVTTVKKFSQNSKWLHICCIFLFLCKNSPFNFTLARFAP